MESEAKSARVEPELEPILEELHGLEPIFHTKAFGTTAADFARMMAPDYWEVGASGTLYGRALILEELAIHPPVDAAAVGWTCRDFGLRRLGTETYLLTYTLHQWKRVTRRATIWQRTNGEWRILYHQGTIAVADEDPLS